MKFLKRLTSLLKVSNQRLDRQADSAIPAGEYFDRASTQHAYTGSESRLYRVYIPARYRSGKPAPLVMVLHGCLQNNLDIEHISQFDAIADRNGFIVLYPFVTRYNDLRTKNCWGWWRREHISPGSGEVEDLWRIIEEVRADYSIDPYRIHIAGISAGGCMAVAALTVHAGRFASGASVAALAYGEGPRAVFPLPFSNKRRYRPLEKTLALMKKVRKDNHAPTPLMIVHSRGDQAVHLHAAEKLRDSWLGYFAADMELIESGESHSTLGTPWTHRRYGAAQQATLVETVFLEGLQHGWYGGAPGKFSFTSAPPISELMWEFFKNHPAA